MRVAADPLDFNRDMMSGERAQAEPLLFAAIIRSAPCPANGLATLCFETDQA